jgi:UDP-N-acetylglucosamine 2-epimerase (non-hydrolysing)
MSGVFIGQLGLPAPDVFLGVGSGSHAEQTARIMIGIEKVLAEDRPDVVVVVGDVNSTVAAALTAAKMLVPVAHVEAGLRSFDRTMPEEINRLVTDRLSDYLFTPSRDADENLRNEGVPPEKIFFVGNVMIDTLLRHRTAAEKLKTPESVGLVPDRYALMTLHRPSNVDDPMAFTRLVDALEAMPPDLDVAFPIHPRTLARLESHGLGARLTRMPRVRRMEPLGYLEFLDIMMHARLVLTDSGGVQEETTVLGVPCLTLRENTERPVTIEQGTNVLVGTNPARIAAEVRRAMDKGKGPVRSPELWDGRAAERIADILLT